MVNHWQRRAIASLDDIVVLLPVEPGYDSSPLVWAGERGALLRNPHWWDRWSPECRVYAHFKALSAVAVDGRI